MPIINRNKESIERPTVENISSEPIPEKKKKTQKKEFKASERLTLKIDPPDLEKLKLITRFEGGALYEKVSKIIEFYLENNYEDRDKKIIKRILENENKNE